MSPAGRGSPKTGRPQRERGVGGVQRVVGLGLCVLDHLYRVDRFEPGQVRNRYDERLVGAGGMMAGAVAQAAALGCNTHVLSLVGADPEGEQVARDLRRAGVKTGGLLHSRELPTTVAVVMVDRGSGERRFLVPDRRRVEARAPDFDLRHIDGRTLLLVDGHFPAQALRAVRRAREVGARVIGDFHRPDARARALLPYLDFPVVPEEFAAAFVAGGGRRALLELRRRWGGTPVVTQGKRGGLYWHGGRVRRYQARAVRVRDTTGAGDAFHGAFAAGLYRGLDVPDAIAQAAHAAAACCTRSGGAVRSASQSQREGSTERPRRRGARGSG